jgi:hypothetical protein
MKWILGVSGFDWIFVYQLSKVYVRSSFGRSIIWKFIYLRLSLRFYAEIGIYNWIHQLEKTGKLQADLQRLPVRLLGV